MLLALEETAKESIDDKRISIAIMSSFIVLILQYFILYYFNIEGTSIGKTIQLLSKIIVGLFFIYSFSIVFKRNRTLFILVYCVSIAVFSANYLFFQQNAIYLNDVLFKFFFICLPSFIYSFSINDRETLEDIVGKSSMIVFMIGTIIGFLVFTNKISLGSYSMSMSYYMLLPAIFYMNKFFEEFSIKSIAFVIISIFIMLSIGSRGAIMCTGAYVILYLVINIRNTSIKKFLSNIIIFMLIILILVNLTEVLMFINDILIKFGIYSRSITLFLRDEVNLSGRADIYEEILYQIQSNPIFGIGLAGDRLYTGGTYSHNIFLEIISGFGVVVGLFILIIIGIISIKALFSKDIEGSNFMLIWFCIGFVPLIVSGSYLTDYQFWIYMGLATRFIKELNVSKRKLKSRDRYIAQVVYLTDGKRGDIQA